MLLWQDRFRPVQGKSSLASFAIVTGCASGALIVPKPSRDTWQAARLCCRRDFALSWWQAARRASILSIDVPSIVIKVQMSDSLYVSTNAAERQEIIKTYANETVANARGKIWASARVPLSINVTDLSPIKAPVTETALPDHQISSDVLAWVKKPASPFASQ